MASVSAMGVSGRCSSWSTHAKGRRLFPLPKQWRAQTFQELALWVLPECVTEPPPGHERRQEAGQGGG